MSLGMTPLLYLCDSLIETLVPYSFCRAPRSSSLNAPRGYIFLSSGTSDSKYLSQVFRAQFETLLLEANFLYHYKKTILFFFEIHFVAGLSIFYFLQISSNVLFILCSGEQKLSPLFLWISISLSIQTLEALGQRQNLLGCPWRIHSLFK